MAPSITAASPSNIAARKPLKQSRGCDSDSRVTSIMYGTGGSCTSPPSNLGNLTYTYDTAGHRLSMAGSLAAVTLPGNIAGGSSTTYNADNEQTTFNGISQLFGANGNLTNDGTNTYTWDARNHLTTISGGNVASFLYEGLGRRQEKVINSTTTQFLYDGLNPLQDLDGAVPPNATGTLLNGLGIDEHFKRKDASGDVSSFVSDALGSTVGLVGSAGTIATSYTYEPFGATTVGGASNSNSYQFTGREDDATGQYYYRALYYNPTNQRFIVQDPIDFRGGFNLYGYALGNPINFRDPFGLWVFGIGLNGGASGAGGGGSWTKELVFDGEGNVGIATTKCGGGMVGAAGVGAGGALSWYPSLSSIFELAGPSLELGTATDVGEGLSGGVSITTQTSPPSVGVNFYGGAAYSCPAKLPSFGGQGCSTNVEAIGWDIFGPSGGGAPFPIVPGM